MAPSPVAPIIAAALGIYNPCKDLVLFVMGRRRDIKALEERISELINLLTLISSEKEKIDESLENSVFTKASQANPVTKAEIAVINKRYIKFIDKYAKSTTNQLSSTTELNASTAALMIHQLNDLKSKVATKKFFKLAKLSRDVAKLSKRASKVVATLKPDYMKKKSEPIQDKLGGGDDNVLPVFDTYVGEVLKHLLEGEHTVGISGRKGVGKTTVLKKLHDRLVEQNSEWGKIIRIDYPAETETQESAAKILMLQNEIVAQLNIHDYPEATKNINQNANAISTFLHHRRYVLLMDHVSSYVDLERLGLRENHDHRKVVICSIENDVTSRMTQVQIEIKGLEKVDARQLFNNIYGELLHDSSKISIVDNMIEYCRGTAGMIERIARHLKKNKDASWDYDMQILKGEFKSHGLIDLDDFEKVYEMAYLRLETSARKCLLYGALFPHRYELHADYLIECWIAEGLIAERADQKVMRNRQLGQGILNRLTEVYLLERYNQKYVMMSPDFRRVAFQLGYTQDEKCVFWVPSMHRTPTTDDWETVTRMSLIGCRVELPNTPRCPTICTLLLQSLEPNLEQLAATFFFHMRSLVVLDLSHAEIGALPASIKKLVNLKSLYLKGCVRLVALPPEAEKLVKLEFLDISGTSISTLPKEIKCMVNMRCLRASLSPTSCDHNSKGKQVVDSDELMIPPGMISNLRNLEELSIDITGTDIQQEIAVAERLATELASLEYLNTLHFNFSNVSIHDTFVSQSKALKNIEHLRSFKISIGRHQIPRVNKPSQASTSGRSEITEHIKSSNTISTSNISGAPSTSGSSEFLSEHNSPAPSNTNVDDVKETPLSDNLQESQKGVQTDSSGLEDDDIKSNLDNDHDHDRSACSSHVKQSRGEQKSNKGCFQSTFGCF